MTLYFSQYHLLLSSGIANSTMPSRPGQWNIKQGGPDLVPLISFSVHSVTETVAVIVICKVRVTTSYGLHKLRTTTNYINMLAATNTCTYVQSDLGQCHTSLPIVTPVQPPVVSGVAELPQSALNWTSKPGTLSAVSLTLDTSSYSSRHNTCDGHAVTPVIDMYAHIWTWPSSKALLIHRQTEHKAN